MLHGVRWSVALLLIPAVSMFMVVAFLAPLLQMPLWLAVGCWTVRLVVGYASVLAVIEAANRDE